MDRRNDLQANPPALTKRQFPAHISQSVVFVSELIAITGIRDHHRLEHLIAIPGIRTGLTATGSRSARATASLDMPVTFVDVMAARAFLIRKLLQRSRRSNLADERNPARREEPRGRGRAHRAEDVLSLKVGGAVLNGAPTYAPQIRSLGATIEIASTTLAEFICASVFQGFVFDNMGTAETAAEG